MHVRPDRLSAPVPSVLIATSNRLIAVPTAASPAAAARGCPEPARARATRPSLGPPARRRFGRPDTDRRPAPQRDHHAGRSGEPARWRASPRRARTTSSSTGCARPAPPRAYRALRTGSRIAHTAAEKVRSSLRRARARAPAAPRRYHLEKSSGGLASVDHVSTSTARYDSRAEQLIGAHHPSQPDAPYMYALARIIVEPPVPMDHGFAPPGRRPDRARCRIVRQAQTDPEPTSDGAGSGRCSRMGAAVQPSEPESLDLASHNANAADPRDRPVRHRPPPQRYCHAAPNRSKLLSVRADTPLLA